MRFVVKGTDVVQMIANFRARLNVLIIFNGVVKVVPNIVLLCLFMVLQCDQLLNELMITLGFHSK